MQHSNTTARVRTHTHTHTCTEGGSEEPTAAFARQKPTTKTPRSSHTTPEAFRCSTAHTVHLICDAAVAPPAFAAPVQPMHARRPHSNDVYARAGHGEHRPCR
jgi:hypothetical protein